MPLATSPLSNTQSLPFHVRVARLSLISALIVLGLYASAIAWQQFGPQGKRALRPTGPVASTAVTTATPSKTATAQPARQSSSTTTAATEPPTTAPAPTAVTPTDANPQSNVPPADVAVSTQPTPTVDATPAPDATAAETSTALRPGSAVAPVLAAAAAKVWWQSRNSMGQSAGRAAQAIGQSTLDSLKHPASATPSPHATAQTEVPATTTTVEPTAPTPEVKTASSTRVLLVNPSTTGGVIHYLVNGATYSLYPGQMQELDGGQTLRVEFHRGGNFGDARRSLTPGRYEFQVTADGWKLVEQTDDDQF